MSDTRGRIETIPAGNRLELRLSGRWEVGCAAELESALAQLRPPGDQPVLIDLSGLDRLDTTGAWLIHRSIEGLRRPQRSVTYQQVHGRRALEYLAEHGHPGADRSET